MSAQALYDTAPLGAVVRYSNGEPEPPARHKHKHRAWKRDNGVGRLVAKAPGSRIGERLMPHNFTLHEGDLTMGGVIAVIVRVARDVTSPLTYEVIGVPPAGAVLCLTSFMGGPELQHLARDRAEAEVWHARQGRYGAPVYHEVQPDGSHLAVSLSALAA
jgi:hypothetical protein